MSSSKEHSNFRSLVFPLFLVLSWLKPQGHYALDQNLNHRPQLYHTVSVTSLLPFHDQSSCNNIIESSTTNGPSKRKASLRVAHRYGACSASPERGNNKFKTGANLAYEILSHDQARVKSIKARLNNFNSIKDSLLTTKKGTPKSGDKKTTNLPAQRGTYLGTGNYVVDIGIGTPAKQLTLVFDTGSDFTWTQCEPCVGSCYKQKQTIFDPSKSTTYSNISCSTQLCSDLESATSISPGCSSSTCVYGIQYGDKSFSVGFFAKETLTLSTHDVLTNIPFGCGQKNQGLFGSTAGLIGLGRHPLSIVSQTAQKFGKVFSYCLPSSKPNSQGYLSFGSSGIPANSRYTPFSTSDALFYKIQIIAIAIGGQPIPLSDAVLKSDGQTIIDSGTVITRLPPSIYNPMRDAFKKLMSGYKATQPFSILDTCYDFSNLSTIKIPIISFYFSGRNVKVDVVPINGVLLAVNGASQVCLAFAEDDSVNIFGNSQQQTTEVVYDVAGGKIGFAPNACA